MKLGYLIALLFLIAGIIGILYGISLNDGSSFGIIAITISLTLPFTFAFFTKTRKPLESKDWLQKNINIGGTYESER